MSDDDHSGGDDDDDDNNNGAMLIKLTTMKALMTMIIKMMTTAGATMTTNTMLVCLLIGCLTSQQQASVSQGRICSDNLTCCHTEIEVADPTFYLTQSQYTDTGPTSPSADPITPGAWQGSHWSANFEVTGMTRPRKNPVAGGIRTRDLPLSRRTPCH